MNTLDLISLTNCRPSGPSRRSFIAAATALTVGLVAAPLLPAQTPPANPAALDTTYNTGTGFDNSVNALAPRFQDGTTVVGGLFRSFNGVPVTRIARLTATGSLDTSFNSGTGFNASVNAVVKPLFAKKYVVAGDFTTYNGVPRSGVARLNFDGSLDTSFNPGVGFDSGANAVTVQFDNKVIVGGGFATYNGVSRNGIARLNADGSLDTSFNPGSGFDNAVLAVIQQLDGKVIVGGTFGSYNGVARNRIARLNFDGSLDTSFNPGAGFDSDVNALTQQFDGKVIVGGAFATFNGVARSGIARLNFNGSLDTGFNPGTGFAGATNSLLLQLDGTIVVGGNFVSYNGVLRNNIAELNTDGSLNTTFNPGTGFDSTVAALAYQLQGRILAGGSFTMYNGTPASDIARLVGTCPF